MMTAMPARRAAPTTPTITPMTIFLELFERPPLESSWRPGRRVTGTSVAEVNVAGMVVATPSTVVTMPVVKVRTEWDREVMGVVMDEESGLEEGEAELETA